jgi:hypothetical protein
LIFCQLDNGMCGESAQDRDRKKQVIDAKYKRRSPPQRSKATQAFEYREAPDIDFAEYDAEPLDLVCAKCAAAGRLLA